MKHLLCNIYSKADLQIHINRQSNYNLQKMNDAINEHNKLVLRTGDTSRMHFEGN